jgi:hypothetical protein
MAIIRSQFDPAVPAGLRSTSVQARPASIGLNGVGCFGRSHHEYDSARDEPRHRRLNGVRPFSAGVSGHNGAGDPIGGLPQWVRSFGRSQSSTTTRSRVIAGLNGVRPFRPESVARSPTQARRRGSCLNGVRPFRPESAGSGPYRCNPTRRRLNGVRPFRPESAELLIHKYPLPFKTPQWSPAVSAGVRRRACGGSKPTRRSLNGVRPFRPESGDIVDVDAGANRIASMESGRFGRSQLHFRIGEVTGHEWASMESGRFGRSQIHYANLHRENSGLNGVRPFRPESVKTHQAIDHRNSASMESGRFGRSQGSQFAGTVSCNDTASRESPASG